MADEQQVKDENSSKGKSKLIIIIVAIVVLLAVGAGGVFFFLGSNDFESNDAQIVESPALLPEASYINIAQPFLFNITGEHRERLVQIKVQIMVRGVKNENLARHHLPLIESTILSSLGYSTSEQLMAPSGRTQLRDQITEDIRLVMIELTGVPVVEKTLFTDFVMQ